jgi:ABC-2 type transport system permease protein
MRKILLLAMREYNAAVRTKAFIVMLVMMPILMGGGIVVIKLTENRVDTKDKRIAVVDRSEFVDRDGQTRTGVVAEALVEAARSRNQTGIRDDKGRQVRPAYLIEVVPSEADRDAQQLALSDRVREHELSAFVEIGRDVAAPEAEGESAVVSYHAPNAALDDARGWVSLVVNDRLRTLRLQNAGLPVEEVNRLTRPTPVEARGLSAVDAQTGAIKAGERSSEGTAILVPMGLMMLMFLMITIGATPLINAVLEEKMNRIAEVMLGSVRPFQLMLAKLLGTVGLSLTVMALYVGGALYALYHLDMLERVPLHILPWFLIYLVAAVLMFGSLFTAIGAACNDLKEAQSLMLPIWLVVMVPLFVWLNVVREPLSGFSTWISLVPTATPMLMLLRQAAPQGIPAWQPWVGLAGVLAFTAVCVWAAGRIFRIGILAQGKPPRLGELVRWVVRG